jgi:tungstate transport system substrate-binding protein
MPTRHLIRAAIAAATFTCVAALISVLGGAPSRADERFIVVASTTSTQDSGLFGYILPIFEAKTGIKVRVVAQGTGQALDTGRRGDADVVFVHARAQELKFVEEGFSTKRYPVMYNDFVVVGPKSDPAQIAGSKDVAAALKAIAATKAPFVSRGDRSGTHLAELALWKTSGLDLAGIRGDWYCEVGQGMGAALNTANALAAYTLSDRATWIAFKNKSDLMIAVEGDRKLFNQYGVMLVNPAKVPSVKVADGQAFIDWLVSPEGQTVLGNYKIGGEQMFFPNATDPNA